MDLIVSLERKRRGHPVINQFISGIDHMTELNETHDPKRKSWIESANAPGCDFPIQNLPFGIFRPPVGEPRGGVAIGDRILDVAAMADLLSGLSARAAADCKAPQLNRMMELGPHAWSTLRRDLSRLLCTEATDWCHRVEPHLTPMANAELLLPIDIPNFTDFFASIFHASNAGRMFRPDNPLMPNYKYVPVAYHSRASSVRVSGTPFARPKGQIKPADAPAPTYGPCRALDYELELGIVIGMRSELGTPVPVGKAAESVFGYCLLNDWSARDIQAWEYQPLGPFLGKNFCTTVSPWIVTAEALAPYRAPAYRRPEGDPAPLPYLTDANDQAHGAIAIELSAYILTAKMREQGMEPFRLSASPFEMLYWTVAQMIAHHTGNGCNLAVGDLLGSGTVSGPERSGWGSLLELSARGRERIDLPSGETRGFIEDGDEVVFRGSCVREGYARIGFGECRGVVLPAN
jgi:fumarylacetoacetase